jgi:hypothetical protein
MMMISTSNIYRLVSWQLHVYNMIDPTFCCSTDRSGPSWPVFPGFLWWQWHQCRFITIGWCLAAMLLMYALCIFILGHWHSQRRPLSRSRITRIPRNHTNGPKSRCMECLPIRSLSAFLMCFALYQFPVLDSHWPVTLYQLLLERESGSDSVTSPSCPHRMSESIYVSIDSMKFGQARYFRCHYHRISDRFRVSS